MEKLNKAIENTGFNLKEDFEKLPASTKFKYNKYKKLFTGRSVSTFDHHKKQFRPQTVEEMKILGRDIIFEVTEWLEDQKSGDDNKSQQSQQQQGNIQQQQNNDGQQAAGKKPGEEEKKGEENTGEQSQQQGTEQQKPNEGNQQGAGKKQEEKQEDNDDLGVGMF